MDSPIELVNRLIFEAASIGASDLHLEPQKDHLLARWRIDGLLREKEKIPKNLENSVISRIKILAGLDIAEKRIGQDGRITFDRQGENLDLRISTLPTLFGEKLVMRILPREKKFLALKDTGLEQLYEELFQLIRRPDGLFLVTGPTGSGKTTTLYAILKEIATPQKNTITIEDPVEYTFAGLNQVPVNNRAGLTFAAGLRWILRQDPDIIMVGEIRDTETARLALSAALTGHLVLATLHTNSCREALVRLMDTGLEPFLLAAALKGVVSQRLVRLLCLECKKKLPPNENEKKFLAKSLSEIPAALWQPVGCPHCDNTGYRGRTGIFEVLKITDEIKNDFFKSHFWPDRNNLHLAGLNKALQGLTSLEEIERVLSLN